MYEHNGSGCFFSNFLSIELTLWHLDPLRASAFVPLPKWIRDKRAVVNVTGTANDCFKWAVLAGLHPAIEHPNRMASYIEHECKYDFSGLNFPVSLNSITPFATNNNISINVYCVEHGKVIIFPLSVTGDVVDGRHVDLLLHEMGGIRHYSTIHNFSRLISGQMNSHNGAVYCCSKCLHAYSSPGLCSHAQLTKFPENPRCRFTNTQKQLPAPFVVYADFESVLKPVSDIGTTQGVTSGIAESSVTQYQEHIVCSYS